MFCLKLASLSAEDLLPEEAAAIRRHLAECPPCQGQWVLFEQTLLTLSQTPEVPLSAEVSHQMWLVCLQHVHQKHAVLQAPHTLEDGGEASGQVVARPPFRFRPHGANSDFHDASPRRDDRKLSNPFTVLFGGRGWGWAMVGGAAAALGTAYFWAPAPLPTPSPTTLAVQPLPAFALGDPGNLVSFRVPTRATASLVDHHAVMGFDPFADHVASSLVSSVALQTPSQSLRPARR